ncbi:MAG: hypothetical protein AAF985_11480 [Bacteroidota bacterium]
MQVLLMKTTLLMLPEIGVLILLVVIAVCLILLTLTLRSIWEALLKSKDEKEHGYNPKSGENGHHGPKSYYQEVIRAEKEFFLKYVNRGADGKYRTVTFSNAVVQAYQAYQGHLADKQAEDQAEKVASEKAVTDQDFAIPDYNTDDCLIQDLDIDALNTNVNEYVAYVSSLIGAAGVGKICLCPDGVNYCNWSSEMFEAFMVDTNVWNVVSVQIFHKDGTLISTSSINAIANSPSGQHKLITMSNQTALDNLPPGKEIRIVFKWLDGEILRCIVMKNIIPIDPDTPTGPSE